MIAIETSIEDNHYSVIIIYSLNFISYEEKMVHLVNTYNISVKA